MAMDSDSGSAEESSQTSRVDRELTVFPAHPSDRRHINLAVSDLSFLMIQYVQKGLLYEMPAHCFSSAIDRLQKSLSQVLVHFCPLAGRLSTSPSDGAISIDCNDAGAAFIEASAENVTVGDVLAAEVPDLVFELFPLNYALNIEGHRLPLLAVQATKLRDGIFLGCSLNHAVVDAASLWSFLSSWAEICAGAETISVLPIHDRCASSAQLNLDPDAPIRRYFPQPLRVKFFHFSKDTMKVLTDRANREPLEPPVSSLQALCGHVWHAVTRARRLQPEEPTIFHLPMDYRARVIPPLPSSYFGNAIQSIVARSTAWELASSDASFAAQVLHRVVHGHGDETVKGWIEAWEKNPKLMQFENAKHVKISLLFLGGSPWFGMYETDFGWGSPVAARSGCANNLDGRISAYPGKAGDGSMDLELCLVPKTMEVLENDQHFLDPLLG